MLYGYRIPSNITWSLSGGSSPAFETDIRLSNSQPSEQTVISGVADSSPIIGEYIDIRADWAVPQGLGAVGILNLSCPAGTRIEVTGRRVGDGGYARDLGGNSDSRTQLVEGRVQLIVVCTDPELDYIGVQIRIYNDAGGVTWADDNTDLLIGEIVPCATTTLCARPARSRGRSSRSTRDRASNGALHIYPHGEYRTESVSIIGTVAEAYKGALAGGVDFQRLQEMQDAPKYRALIIPRGVNDYGQGPDYDLVQEKAIFAAVSWGKIAEEEAVMRVSVPMDAEEAV